MINIRKMSEERIQKISVYLKRFRKYVIRTPIELQNKCLDAWDGIAADLDTKILPLIPVIEGQPVTNLIFGSGGFSTAEFQVQQYQLVNQYTETPPVILQGLVTNKNESHQCNASKISQQYDIPLAELDFIDWYHEFHNARDPNPIQATRYWFPPDDANLPPKNEIEKRFKIPSSRVS